MSVLRDGDPNAIPSTAGITEKPKMIFFETVPDDAEPLSNRLIEEVAALRVNEVSCRDCHAVGRLWVSYDSEEGRDEAFSVIRSEGKPGYSFVCFGCSIKEWGVTEQHPRAY